MFDSNAITIKELAKLCKLSTGTIDHYIDMGLLKVVKRKKRQRLLNKKDSPMRIKDIQELLQQGLSLDDIRYQLAHYNHKANIFKKILKAHPATVFFITGGIWTVLSMAIGSIAGRSR